MNPLIVFEGIDGTGKGGQIKRTVAYLRDRLGQDSTVETKDPGGTPLGAAIREVMYEKVHTTQMAPGVVDLLFFASHLQNWKTVVQPALAAGKIVVTDRWWYSQEAYMTERYVPKPIQDAYILGHGGEAGLFIFLHGNVKVVVDRARARTEETHQATKAWNDYEVLDRIQETYKRLFSALPEWCPVCVDGKDMDQVWEEVQAHIDGFVWRMRREHASV